MLCVRTSQHQRSGIELLVRDCEGWYPAGVSRSLGVPSLLEDSDPEMRRLAERSGELPDERLRELSASDPKVLKDAVERIIARRKTERSE